MESRFSQPPCGSFFGTKGPPGCAMETASQLADGGCICREGSRCSNRLLSSENVLTDLGYE